MTEKKSWEVLKFEKRVDIIDSLSSDSAISDEYDISTKFGFFEIIIKTFLLFNFFTESTKISSEILSPIISFHFILSSSSFELFLLVFFKFLSTFGRRVEILDKDEL